MFKAALVFSLVTAWVQAAPLCPDIVEKLAIRPEVPQASHTQVWNAFPALGAIPPVPTSEQRKLFLLQEPDEQHLLFHQLDLSLSETGNVGLLARQRVCASAATVGIACSVYAFSTGDLFVGSLFAALGVPPLLALPKTNCERLETLDEIQSIGVFRHKLQQQAVVIKSGHPGAQAVSQKQFGGEAPFHLSLASSLDAEGRPSTLIVVQWPRGLSREEEAAVANAY